MKTASLSRTTGWAALCLLALLLSLETTARAQGGPGDHESHHPEAAGGPTDPDTEAPGGARSPAGGGGMAGMGDMEQMMERMGVPPPRELYPEMMRLEGLTPERQRELLRRAQERRADGSARLGVGLESLDQALRSADRTALIEALAEARAGLDELESGLATERALEAGEEPRKVALDWFREEMRLETSQTVTDSAGPFGLGWFHAFVMTLLVVFAGVMILMYFHKMRRAGALLAELAQGSDASPAPPAPAAPPGPPERTSASAPPERASAFDALRETGSCGGCKNPCATRVRVAHIVDETPGVKTFRFTPLDGGPLPFEYLPGQFLNVIVPANGDTAETTKRSYTIASSPTQTAYCEITVKRESNGLVSRHLHDTLHAGDELRIAAPYGRFTFTGEEAGSIVLIGCGVGITPLMSVIRYLTDRSWPGEITLFFGFRTPDEFVFRDELERLEKRHPNLRVVPTVSRPDGAPWSGHTGRIGPDLVREVLPDIAERLVHLCGPKPMMDATRDFLLELGVPRERIRFESFGPAVPPPKPGRLAAVDAARAPTVEFVRSQKSAPLPAELTILDVADSIGVEIEWSCRSGTCGSCAVKLVSGQVTMEVDDGLDDEDREAGLILTCQAHATADVAVEA